jgi:hypothetical protein
MVRVCEGSDRGRETRLSSGFPPCKPDGRFSRILAHMPATLGTGRYFVPTAQGFRPTRVKTQTIGHQFVKAD